MPHSSGIPLVGGVGIGRGGGLPLPAGKEGMPGLSSLSNFGMGKDAMHVPGLPPALGTGKEGARGASVRSYPLLSLWRVRAVIPPVVSWARPCGPSLSRLSLARPIVRQTGCSGLGCWSVGQLGNKQIDRPSSFLLPPSSIFHHRRIVVQNSLRLGHRITHFSTSMGYMLVEK